MTSIFFGHLYDHDATRPMQCQPRLVELIMQHFIDECEAEYWQEKQTHGCISDAVNWWVTRCIMKQTFVLQQVCKMWTAILRGNVGISQRYLDVRRLFLSNSIARQSNYQVIKQYDGAEMFIYAQVCKVRHDCLFEVARDCILESVSPCNFKNNFLTITILNESNYFACENVLIETTTVQTDLDRFIPANSIVILKCKEFGQHTISLHFRANHDDALQHFLKKRKLSN